MDLDFANALERCLAEIPRGRVASCGTVARALGDVRAARAVATWLIEHPDAPGAHRVVRADGRPVLSAGERRLSREGAPLSRDRVDSALFVGSLPPLEFLGPLREEQRRLASRVIERDSPGPLETIAGVDAAYSGDAMFAAAASISIEDLETIEIAVVRREVEFPYIPTFLAYREFPGIEAVVRRLAKRPDAILIDGHGRLHPNLCGVACYAGIQLDIPTIGVAKHPLAGRVKSGSHRGADLKPIQIDGAIRGYAWIPPNRSRAIYVSVGHRISLPRALELVRKTTRHGYPEALRIADRLSREMKGMKNGKRVRRGEPRRANHR